MLCSAQRTGRTGAYGPDKQAHFLWTARHFKTFLFLYPCLNEQLTHRPRWAAFSFCINHVSRATPCQYYQWDNSTLQSAVFYSLPKWNTKGMPTSKSPHLPTMHTIQPSCLCVLPLCQGWGSSWSVGDGKRHKKTWPFSAGIWYSLCTITKGIIWRCLHKGQINCEAGPAQWSTTSSQEISS